jgi:hypothetical protein
MEEAARDLGELLSHGAGDGDGDCSGYRVSLVWIDEASASGGQQDRCNKEDYA